MTVKNVLVTGSSGTVGTRLCERMLKDGYHVTGFDRVDNRWVREVDGITTKGDILNEKDLERLDKDYDVVIHLAANARVYNLVVDPSKAMENFQGLFNALEFCRKNGIKRFIFASSREVYGNSHKTKHSEDEAYVKNCESPYTASKIGGEALVNAYSQCYGIDSVIVRFSNVYGMYDESDRVIPLFIRLTDEGKDLVVFGKEKFLDFTYIDDAVSGVIRCVERFEKVRGNVFNIASGKAYSIERIAAMIQEKMKGVNRVIIKDSRTGEVERFVADTSKAEKLLGHRSRTDIGEGIDKAIEWYRKTAR